jgi:two-component system, NarL family, response regulator NreC
MIKIFVADDHPAIIDAIKSYLKDEDYIEIVGSANNGKEVIEQLKTSDADVLLLDYMMPEMDGLEVCKYVEDHFPHIKTIVISGYKEPTLIKKFVDTGAVGYMTKDSTKVEYINAIKDVSLGVKVYSSSVREMLIKYKNKQESFEPTSLELEVLKLIVDGKSTQEIAEILHRSHFTIDERRKKILERFKMYEGENFNMYSLINYLTKKGFL